jgi:hypothetical protein
LASSVHCGAPGALIVLLALGAAARAEHVPAGGFSPSPNLLAENHFDASPALSAHWWIAAHDQLYSPYEAPGPTAGYYRQVDRALATGEETSDPLTAPAGSPLPASGVGSATPIDGQPGDQLGLFSGGSFPPAANGGGGDAGATGGGGSQGVLEVPAPPGTVLAALGTVTLWLVRRRGREAATA